MAATGSTRDRQSNQLLIVTKAPFHFKGIAPQNFFFDRKLYWINGIYVSIALLPLGSQIHFWHFNFPITPPVRPLVGLGRAQKVKKLNSPQIELGSLPSLVKGHKEKCLGTGKIWREKRRRT